MSDVQKIARLDEIHEGELLSREVEGELVCLARVAGCIYAFTDNCTHISGPLNEGELEGHTLTCPWHGAQFDVRTGQVLRGPARQDILTYPVKIEDESILISLPDEE
jgi:nitrite reductase/ring-hydroxylating ferredoxin subunit